MADFWAGSMWLNSKALLDVRYRFSTALMLRWQIAQRPPMYSKRRCRSSTLRTGLLNLAMAAASACPERQILAGLTAIQQILYYGQARSVQADVQYPGFFIKTSLAFSSS